MPFPHSRDGAAQRRLHAASLLQKKLLDDKQKSYDLNCGGCGVVAAVERRSLLGFSLPWAAAEGAKQRRCPERRRGLIRRAVIIDAVRTPMARGKPGGALASVHPADLLGLTLKALLARSDLDPASIDDVIVGCSTQVAEQANIARMGALAAGLPPAVPATIIDRKCGSSQQAVHFAAQGVVAGAYDIVIAAGVESMSRIPMGSNRMGRDDVGPAVSGRFSPGLVQQGVAAELVAARWGIGRDELDACAAASHRRAAATAAAGGFDAEIISVGGGGVALRRDEPIRPATTVEGLAALKPSFSSDEMASRFPEIEWRITAGNSSQLADGAGAMLIMEEGAARRLGFRPRAGFVAFDVIGDDPILMLTAPIAATRRVLAKADLDIGSIDHIEVNEAFASVPLAWQREFPVDPARLNPRGGAIALGHPLGCSGVRLMTTMLCGLEQTRGKLGLQTMCEAGGMANATIIERL